MKEDMQKVKCVGKMGNDGCGWEGYNSELNDEGKCPNCNTAPEWLK